MVDTVLRIRKVSYKEFTELGEVMLLVDFMKGGPQPDIHDLHAAVVAYTNQHRHDIPQLGRIKATLRNSRVVVTTLTSADFYIKVRGC